MYLGRKFPISWFPKMTGGSQGEYQRSFQEAQGEAQDFTEAIMPNHGGAMTLPGEKSEKFGKFIPWRLEEFDALLSCEDFCSAFSLQGLQAFNQNLFF